jgi:hypothetical protein
LFGFPIGQGATAFLAIIEVDALFQALSASTADPFPAGKILRDSGWRAWRPGKAGRRCSALVPEGAQLFSK